MLEEGPAVPHLHLPEDVLEMILYRVLRDVEGCRGPGRSAWWKPRERLRRRLLARVGSARSLSRWSKKRRSSDSYPNWGVWLIATSTQTSALLYPECTPCPKSCCLSSGSSVFLAVGRAYLERSYDVSPILRRSLEYVCYVAFLHEPPKLRRPQVFDRGHQRNHNAEKVAVMIGAG